MKNRNYEIIVECCQNHNGKWDNLERMVYDAVDAGAKFIKIQSIWAEDLTPRKRFEEGDPGHKPFPIIKRPYQSEYNRLLGLELSLEQQERFVDLCKSLGVIPMTTVFATHRLESVRSIGFEWLKIASYDCGSIHLLQKAKELFPNVIVSTGASYDSEIKRCASILGRALKGFLHAVTIYPTPLEEMNLARMLWLRKFTPMIGYSDHSRPAETGLIGSKSAILLGAKWVERHFTVLCRDETRDGHVSINPAELKELVEFAQRPVETEDLRKASDIVLGQAARDLSIVELSNRDYYRGRFGEVKGDRIVYNFED
ncbi:MAG TPA: N-acetylneuraminate synthase family protein [Candidatus Wunengus sp. YC60]|uniref:N-acetylneuraminate synthase family protein n=1 Tax=Candidatus Wunengus sp. YC60 TaxID=3367697 RepID=UPI00402948F1